MPNRKLLRISSEVLNAFYKHRQTSSRVYESGGILVGRVLDEYILIEKATTPGRDDKQGSFFFHRHKSRAQSLVNSAFAESQGKQIYIGEWHTHREETPHPSFIDKWEIKRAFKKSRLNLKFIILIIVGNDNTPGNIWVGYHDGQNMRNCYLITPKLQKNSLYDEKRN
ncbi:MAG: Mov34/MPN/PAD-1 family protein [Desulfobacteraceae bacterium]|nr:Mov34/MPN/PAD-1 family protein [Desulfobacteraceae bacterium]